MFDEQTFEVILQRMLDRIPDDLDKREGSIIYDAMAPAALELAQVYYLMSVTYRLIFGETSDGDLLDLRVADFGIYRKQATPAIRRGIFRNSNNELMAIPIGSRFAIDEVTFTVVEMITLGNYVLQADEPGEIGNKMFGDLLPIEAIEGLGTAELTEVVVPGQEKQSDASLYAEFKNRLIKPALSGNAQDYKKWAKEIQAIEEAFIYENWNGPNTVKIIVMNKDKRSPSPQIIEEVRNHIEEQRPVGAIVTVVGLNEKVVSVTANVTLNNNSLTLEARSSIAENIANYFKSISGVENIVRFTAVGNAILDSVGVIDYSDLKIDLSTSNIPLETNEVPVLGTLDLQFVTNIIE